MRNLDFCMRAACIATCVTIAAQPANSQQDTFRPDLRRELQKQFGTPEPAPTPTRDGQRRDRVLGTIEQLNRLQERRINVSPDFKADLRGEPLINLMETTSAQDLVILSAWNKFALDLNALDHTIPQADSGLDATAYGEQFGPARTSRALGIVHLAMFEAINAIDRKFKSYIGPDGGDDIQKNIFDEVRISPASVTRSNASAEVAVNEAAYRILIELYPKKRARIDAQYNELTFRIRAQGESKSLGLSIGQAAARAVLLSRGFGATGFFDGSELPEPSVDIFQTADARRWHRDPISKLNIALGGNWSHVKPFSIPKAEAFRPAPPPKFTSPEFVTAFKEVKKLGGDPTAPTQPANSRWPTKTDRMGDPGAGTGETFKAIFWGYDGTALLCAPPRLYNMIATSIATKEKKIENAIDMARYLALVNLALADAGISAWEAKYYYLYPRPVTAVRVYDADQSQDGKADARWTPLGAPVTNGQTENRNLTPPFPSYPSGHAVFGAALFQILRKYYGVDMTDSGTGFEFVSDEYNGENYGPGDTTPRARRLVKYSSFSEAEEENGQSRIWLGIHWSFDKTAGIEQGRKVADHVFANALQPVQP